MKKFYRMILSGLVAGMLLAGSYHYRQQRLQENLAGQILRFHVIANSDETEDQALKLKVRDRIGAYLGGVLSHVEDLEECERIVQECLPEIEDCAEKVIEKEGVHYAVTAAVTDADFPKKTYGSYTFPKGRYKALKVTIGDGRGENWWCVMYPNLCFADSMYEVIDERSKEELREVLTKEDYEEIMAEGELRVRFKYLDGLLSLFQKK